MTTIVSIAQGGTGANNAAAARNTLGAAANTGGVFTGAINVATANITTIETGNTLTLSTGTASNGNIIFSANGAEDMRITTAGRVGIGTTIPPYILSAETGTATQLYLRGGSTGFTHASILLSSNTADSPQSRGLGTYMFNEGTDSTWYMGTFYNAGNTWGVGVAGGTTFQPQTADSANIRLSVANTGNVGISILSPTSNLHVVGNANVTTGINTATLNATTVNVTSTLGGGSTLTIQPNVTISQSLTVTGNLIVSGSSTTLNTEILIVEDADIVLLSNVTGTPALNSGITVNRGTSTNTFLRWSEDGDRWGWTDDGTTFYSFDNVRSGLVTTNTTFATINTTTATMNTATTNRVLKAGDTMTGNLIVSGATVNTATANITTIVTGNALTLSTGTGSNSNVIISANGTEYLRVTNTGFVGIGNTTPTVRMEVSGDARVSGYYRFSGNPSNPSDSTASIYDQSGIGPTISGLSVTFRTGSTPAERMRIESTGNVSIGTTDTSFGGLLVTQTGMSSNLAGVQIYRDTGNYGAMQMNGTNGAYIDFSTPGVDYLGRIIYFTSGNTMQFVTNTTVKMVIDSTGNTGFGITNPNAKIDIVQSGSAGGVANTTGSGLGLTHGVGAGADALALALRTTGSGTNSLTGSAFIAQIISHTTNSNALEMYTTGNSPLVFGTSATERMRISGTGNVGIGTTNPSQRLSVFGSGMVAGFTSSTTTGSITIAHSGNGGTIGYTNSGAGNLSNMFYVTTGAGTVGSGIVMDNGGNVGIGVTNPGEKLQVNDGSIYINNENSGLIVDAGGSKRIGFMKYSGHEAYISRVTGQDFGIVRVGTSDIKSVSGLVHDMYFASGGAIGINYTAPSVYGQLTISWDATASSINNTTGLGMRPEAETSDAYFALFFNSTGSGIGSIRRVGTTNSVAFNTTSDRRLKENILPANSASTLIDNIQVVQYDWKTGSHIKYGVIAQDLYDIIPEAVSVGDPEETENLRNPWGVDYSKLVPMLIKEIQELRTRVVALESGNN